MDEQTARMIQQLKSNPAMLQALMQSRDGQALMQMLSGGDRGASLQRAAQSAAKGNPAEMVRMVNQLMQSPEDVYKRQAGTGIWYSSHSCHAEAGCDHHPRPDTQQHGFPCLRQSG